MLVLSGDGLNCERETAVACREAGLEVEVRTVPELAASTARANGLREVYAAVVLPGGFAHGDAWDAGRVLALQLRHQLSWDLRRYAREGGFVLGVCNGCQALVRAGVFGPGVSLAPNPGGRFVDRWVRLQVLAASGWLAGLDALRMPVRHREGWFYIDRGPSNAIDGAPALAYAEPLHGEAGTLAALSAEEGRVLAMMPHPEAALWASQAPGWSPLKSAAREPGPGRALFDNLARQLRNA